nr:hypothetical protein [Tanacetum cinerariifolium]
HPTHYKQNSSTRSQQAATRNRGKSIVKSPQPIYDQEPSMVDDDDETSKDKEIDKLMALISLSNARYESQRIGNVAGARETVGSSMVHKSRIQCYNCKEFGHVSKECQKPIRAKDAAYHREKILLCKQEEAGIQLNAEQADWKDDTDDEFDDQELEAHYMYMAKVQEVSPDAVDYGPIFDTEPEQKVQNDDHYDVFAIEYQHPEQSKSVHETYLIEQDAHNVLIESVDMNSNSEQIDDNDEDADLAKERELLASLIEKLKCEIDESKNCNKFLETSNKVTPDASDNSGPIFDSEPLQKVSNNANYNVFAIECEHPEQSKSVNDTYLIEQDEHNVIIDSLDISYDREQIDQDDDDDDDLANERELLASLIDKLKCEIDDSKNRNKFLETSNKVLVDKLKGKIEDFKTKNKSLESSNNRFKEANNKLSETNELMYKDLKKFQAELDRHNDVKINADLEKFHLCLREEMVADLRYFNSLELEVDSLKTQLETQKTQFLNEIDRLSREYYYADHMNAILGVYIELDEVTNLQCDYLELLEKCECLEKSFQ